MTRIQQRSTLAKHIINEIWQKNVKPFGKLETVWNNIVWRLRSINIKPWILTNFPLKTLFRTKNEDMPPVISFVIILQKLGRQLVTKSIPSCGSFNGLSGDIVYYSWMWNKKAERSQICPLNLRNSPCWLKKIVKNCHCIQITSLLDMSDKIY